MLSLVCVVLGKVGFRCYMGFLLARWGGDCRYAMLDWKKTFTGPERGREEDAWLGIVSSY